MQTASHVLAVHQPVTHVDGSHGVRAFTSICLSVFLPDISKIDAARGPIYKTSYDKLRKILG